MFFGKLLPRNDDFLACSTSMRITSSLLRILFPGWSRTTVIMNYVRSTTGKLTTLKALPTEFAFCLTFKLRFGHFYRNDGGQAFHKVFTRNRERDLFEKAAVFAVFFELTCECAAETAHVGTAVTGADVIGEMVGEKDGE